MENVAELQSKVEALERSNFDLRLRLHYLNEKYVNTETSSLSSDNDISKTVPNNSTDLQAENNFSKRRILDLESELQQIQQLLDREAAEFQKALKTKSSDNFHSDESRKRDRDLAQAVADHDSALIDKLKEEVSFLRIQQSTDKATIRNLRLEVSQKALLLEENKELKKLNEILHMRNLELEDRVKQLDSCDLSTFTEASTKSNADLLKENQILRSKLKESILNQDLILRRMKDSTEQLRKMENEEIRRLQLELDQVINEKALLVQRHNQLESNCNELKLLLSISSTSLRDSSKLDQSQKERIEHEKVIEMYRQRELELMTALEGVIRRCQSLESLSSSKR